MATVGATLGVDLAYFAPPDEHHLDPVSLLEACSSLLLLRFFEGFRAQLAEDAEQAGRRAAGLLTRRVSALFTRAGFVETGLTAEVRAAADATAQVAKRADETQRLRGAEHSEHAISDELRVQWDFPVARANRLASVVRHEGLALVDAGIRS